MIILFVCNRETDTIYEAETNTFPSETTTGYEIHSPQLHTSIQKHQAILVHFWDSENTKPIPARLYHTKTGQLILRPL
jgi:hypothetical protein